MMYLTGTITSLSTEHTCYARDGECKGTIYICKVITRGVLVMRASTRSRQEALAESLKFIGSPL